MDKLVFKINNLPHVVFHNLDFRKYHFQQLKRKFSHSKQVPDSSK